MKLSYNNKNILAGTILVSSVFICLYLLVGIHDSPFAQQMPFLYFVLFVIVTFIGVTGYRLLGYFEKGEDGEEKVYRLLSNLPNTYHVIRDVTISDKGNIDIVVISPFGIWTIEVKNYKDGEITFENGLLCRNHYPIEGKPLKQTYAEAKVLERFIQETLNITVPVTPVLVFANYRDTMKFGMKEIEGVHVIGNKWLIELLKNKTVLNNNLIEKYYDQLIEIIK